jgi:hypothetical protein
MVIQKKKNIFKYPSFWLLTSSFFVEVLNIVLTWSLGSSQQNTCPVPTFPGELSIYLGVASLLLVIAAFLIAKNKIVALALLVFWATSLVLIGYVLQFVAMGGINFCNI